MFSLLFTLLASSVSAQSNTNLLPPLAPAYGEIKPTFWEQHGTGVIIAVLLLLIVTSLIVLWILRAKPSAAISPETAARQALEKLRFQPEDGNVLSQVSQNLRRFMAAAFGLPPGESTTAEFSAALAANQKVGAQLAGAVSDLLHECDRRKFAPAKPGAPLDAANCAFALVLEVEKERARQNSQTQA